MVTQDECGMRSTLHTKRDVISGKIRHKKTNAHTRHSVAVYTHSECVAEAKNHTQHLNDIQIECEYNTSDAQVYTVCFVLSRIQAKIEVEI